MLRPIDNAVRERRCLNGLWRFRPDPGGEGRRAEWWSRPLEGGLEMPVPASYGDVHPALGLRDHVGDVWYQTDVWVPAGWRGRRVALRFDAATHAATVWAGSVEVARHRGGYTPFEAEITPLAVPGAPIRVTVCVSNELSFATIPPGEVEVLEDGRRRQHWFHDFFNHAGLNRSVWLCATPVVRLDEIRVVTGLEGGTGSVSYAAEVEGGQGTVEAALAGPAGDLIARCGGAAGELIAPAVHPWAPGDGHLYTLSLRVTTSGGGEDRYEIPVGVRTVAVDGERLLINGRPFRFRGTGWHEDADARGRGHDDTLRVRDLSLMAWLGANSFRTSHYPYAEEVIDYADRHGLVVIDEAPAVGLHLGLGADRRGVPARATFGPGAVDEGTREAHLGALRELVARDRNHPSVVMWSLANEPDSTDPAARAYFAPLVEEMRRLDPTRPLCFANARDPRSPSGDAISDLFDVLCLNRYFGWYVDTADLVSAERHLTAELRAWAARYAKPIVVTEYGADAIGGLRSVEGALWSEEYQRDVLAMCHRAFDRVPAVIGEQVWNLADFDTGPSLMRPGGNRKGVFTRDRRPKLAAQLLRERWRGSPSAPGPGQGQVAAGFADGGGDDPEAHQDVEGVAADAEGEDGLEGGGRAEDGDDHQGGQVEPGHEP